MQYRVNVNHMTFKDLFLCYINISFCNLLFLLLCILKTNKPGIFFKTRKILEKVSDKCYYSDIHDENYWKLSAKVFKEFLKGI